MFDRQIADPGAMNSLLLAIIAASDVPLVLLDGNSNILAASTSFNASFSSNMANPAGQSLFALGAGDWNVPEMRSLIEATISGCSKIGSYEIDLFRQGQGTRRLVLGAEKLSYADPSKTRMLLTIADVTEARLAERLKETILEEKTILLLELQHRVANSLQVIASVLMQSARRVQSEEIKTHLFEAHNRVMSVATVQRHLTATTISNVDMRAYLTELCQSIGASMISHDHDLVLTMNIDESVTTADFSISIGLVVTELVINALKHAFPGQRSGTINITYNGADAAWMLSVADDGVGRPTDPRLHYTGLGTSIVRAIADRLSAQIEHDDGHPGTKVSMLRSASGPVQPTLGRA